MKNRAVVSARGTITIPEPIRKLAHIRPGDLIEFKPEKDRIVLKHLVIVKHPEEALITESEWDKFDKLVRAQVRSGQYKSYADLTKAKLHSRILLHKK